jgi:hypothetical protein
MLDPIITKCYTVFMEDNIKQSVTSIPETSPQPDIIPQPETLTPIVTTQKKTFPFIIINLIILVLLLIGLLGYFNYRNYLKTKQIKVSQSIAIPSIKLIPPFTTVSIADNNSNSTSQAASVGKSCVLVLLNGGGTITYYDDGNKYLLAETLQNPTNKSNYTYYTLYTGTHYYMWTDPLVTNENTGSIASVYTSEEAKNLSLADSAQLREVQQNPEKCNSWQVDSQKFVPPTNITFTTTQQMMDKMQQMSEKNASKMCQVCLTQYKTTKEQIDCFSVGFVFTQSPRDVVEKAFNKYCLNK